MIIYKFHPFSTVLLTPQACGKWASTLDADSLLKTAAEYVDRAKSCGYTGLVMLHGLMLSAGAFSWQPDLYVNHHPSYYGMMVASFTRKISWVTHAVTVEVLWFLSFDKKNIFLYILSKKLNISCVLLFGFELKYIPNQRYWVFDSYYKKGIAAIWITFLSV